MNKIALITGASAGIGEATAKSLAAVGFNLILAARRVDRLEKLGEELSQNHNIKTVAITLDVRDKVNVEKTIHELPVEWQAIDVLVNNAGLAQGRDPIQSGTTDNWDTMIDTNLKGLLYVTHAVLPFMTKRKSGHIVNIASIAGIDTYANGNVYCATKHAVRALTSGMRIDLLSFKIKVTAINPGLVHTEFAEVRFHGDKAKVKATYQGFEPLMAEDIADAVAYVVTRPPNVEIAEMTIVPRAQADGNHLLREE